MYFFLELPSRRLSLTLPRMLAVLSSVKRKCKLTVSIECLATIRLPTNVIQMTFR